MNRLQYICVQPRLLYYAWQVEVMINNFIKNGIEPSQINIILAVNLKDQTSSEENVIIWNKLIEKYSDVKFYSYLDTRQQPIRYIASVRPNILKQHFKNYPELSNVPIFYHDCDMIFTKPPNFEHLLNDKIWYLSDTNSYINYDYIIAKGNGIYEQMCDIVGIDKVIPKLINSNSGGAQYLMKNLSWHYWEKVEKDSETLFYEITNRNFEIKKMNPDYHEIQIWCADMWSVLWNAWLYGNETKVVNEMGFCWSTDPIDKWKEKPIYHNAGVTESGKCFYKGDYINKLPYDLEDTFSDEFCSKLYFKEVLDTAKVSPLKT